ncbi:unnamed protein product [Nippostrongylus brasiliensis]|uniref:Uncharacterized protein n=1 Tax=Nippostrongylus brasiliensis TaxID=27835 RepID=A0A0N4YJ70_NIPBR|nr:unnamed protein product [Nippostrongylus brasiliensis]
MVFTVLMFLHYNRALSIWPSLHPYHRVEDGKTISRGETTTPEEDTEDKANEDDMLLRRQPRYRREPPFYVRRRSPYDSSQIQPEIGSRRPPGVMDHEEQ